MKKDPWIPIGFHKKTWVLNYLVGLYHFCHITYTFIGFEFILVGTWKPLGPTSAMEAWGERRSGESKRGMVLMGSACLPSLVLTVRTWKWGNRRLEKEIPIENHRFCGAMLVFGSVLGSCCLFVCCFFWAEGASWRCHGRLETRRFSLFWGEVFVNIPWIEVIYAPK